jgi:Eukaryotic aspartyl protease
VNLFIPLYLERLVLGYLPFVLVLLTIEALTGVSSYWAYVTSVGITKPGAAPKLYPGFSSPGQAFVLDSGTTLSLLPPPLFNAIVSDFSGAQLDQSSGLYDVPCADASLPGTLDFGFGNTIIHVPWHELILQSGSVCTLAINATSAESPLPILGGKGFLHNIAHSLDSLTETF